MTFTDEETEVEKWHAWLGNIMSLPKWLKTLQFVGESLLVELGGGDAVAI